MAHGLALCNNFHKSGQRSFIPQTSKLKCLPMPMPSTRCFNQPVPLYVFVFELVFVQVYFCAAVRGLCSMLSSVSHLTPKPPTIPSATQAHWTRRFPW